MLIKRLENNSYRYSGSNPNNYVCFGSDEEVCLEDNLYRIIGVFDDTGEIQVKLIKYDYSTTVLNLFSDSYSNVIDDSVYTNTYYRGTIDLSTIGIMDLSIDSASDDIVQINDSYVNHLGDYSALISEHIWKIDVISFSTVWYDTLKAIYQEEFSSYADTHTSKINLIYISDYEYAMSPTNWNVGFLNYDAIIGDSWMWMGLNELTITRISTDPSIGKGYILENGILKEYGTIVTLVEYKFAIRPTFYLNSDVQIYLGCTGTIDDPYRIVL